MKTLLLILLSIVYLNADLLTQKIENIIGKQKYLIHQKLIENEIENKKLVFTTNENSINYPKLLEILKSSGLLNTEFETPKENILSFELKGNRYKSLKNLKQALTSLGYSYFIPFQVEDNETYIVKIRFKSKHGLDPLLFVNELSKIDASVININKISDENWEYSIDFTNAKTFDTIKITSNEKIKLNKPLKPYLLEIDQGTQLVVLSHTLNHWYPKIAFFDKNLELINSVDKTRVYKGVKIDVPRGTKYIQVDDAYSLLNIKRGLTIIVKEEI